MSINMGYCRFQNTLAALRECSNALADQCGLDPLCDLSEDERKAAIKLFELCGELAADYGPDAEA